MDFSFIKSSRRQSKLSEKAQASVDNSKVVPTLKRKEANHGGQAPRVKRVKTIGNAATEDIRSGNDTSNTRTIAPASSPAPSVVSQTSMDVFDVDGATSSAPSVVSQTSESMDVINVDGAISDKEESAEAEMSG
jgi:hypothetical protein